MSEEAAEVPVVEEAAPAKKGGKAKKEKKAPNQHLSQEKKEHAEEGLGGDNHRSQYDEERITLQHPTRRRG